MRRPARERLRELLGRRSKPFPKLRELQEQVSWIASVGSVDGLIEWLDAREALGLLDRDQFSYARDVVVVCLGLSNERLDAQMPPPKQRRPWDEQLALINAREAKRRQNWRPVGYRVTPKPPSTAERMAAAWERLTDKGQAA